jgi:hypothetical protein
VNGLFIITFVKDENKAKRPLEGSGMDATPAPSAKYSPTVLGGETRGLGFSPGRQPRREREQTNRVKCEKIEGAILMARLRGDLVLQVQFMESLKAFD